MKLIYLPPEQLNNYPQQDPDYIGSSPDYSEYFETFSKLLDLLPIPQQLLMKQYIAGTPISDLALQRNCDWKRIQRKINIICKLLAKLAKTKIVEYQNHPHPLINSYLQNLTLKKTVIATGATYAQLRWAIAREIRISTDPQLVLVLKTLKGIRIQ